MNKVVWHQGPTASAKTLEVEMNFGRSCRGQHWLEVFDKLSLRRQMRGYSSASEDELVFDNVIREYEPNDGGLSTKEFLKLANKETKTWRGFRTSGWDTIRFISVNPPDRVFPDLGDEAWQYIDEFVYHYFRSASADWSFHVFRIDGVRPDFAELEAKILEDEPFAIFTVEDLLAAGGELENYDYGCQRLEELGIPFIRNANGSFSTGVQDRQVDYVEFVFNQWDNNFISSRYNRDAGILVIDDGRKIRKTIVLFDLDSDEYIEEFLARSTSFETFDQAISDLSDTHDAQVLEFGCRPLEWYEARKMVLPCDDISSDD